MMHNFALLDYFGAAILVLIVSLCWGVVVASSAKKQARDFGEIDGWHVRGRK